MALRSKWNNAENNNCKWRTQTFVNQTWISLGARTLSCARCSLKVETISLILFITAAFPSKSFLARTGYQSRPNNWTHNSISSFGAEFCSNFVCSSCELIKKLREWPTQTQKTRKYVARIELKTEPLRWKMKRCECRPIRVSFTKFLFLIRRLQHEWSEWQERMNNNLTSLLVAYPICTRCKPLAPRMTSESFLPLFIQARANMPVQSLLI